MNYLEFIASLPFRKGDIVKCSKEGIRLNVSPRHHCGVVTSMSRGGSYVNIKHDNVVNPYKYDPIYWKKLNKLEHLIYRVSKIFFERTDVWYYAGCRGESTHLRGCKPNMRGDRLEILAYKNKYLPSSKRPRRR